MSDCLWVMHTYLDLRSTSRRPSVRDTHCALSRRRSTEISSFAYSTPDLNLILMYIARWAIQIMMIAIGE